MTFVIILWISTSYSKNNVFCTYDTYGNLVCRRADIPVRYTDRAAKLLLAVGAPSNRLFLLSLTFYLHSYSSSSSFFLRCSISSLVSLILELTAKSLPCANLLKFQLFTVSSITFSLSSISNNSCFDNLLLIL